jgi:hypothetical protein
MFQKVRIQSDNPYFLFDAKYLKLILRISFEIYFVVLRDKNI